MLVDKIRHSIPAELLGRGRIAVAFSGGADSLALLLALNELRAGKSGMSLMALHCNFHLRGDESDGDARFCAEVCRRLDVELKVRDFHGVREDCAKSGESVEMVCRRLRYDWFEESTAEGWTLAVAHHIEDNRETMLINLMRGTGVKGLRGMVPYDTGRRVLRPMLEVSRAEIEDYLRGIGATWRDDSTNAVPDVVRNKLRLEVVPLFNHLFPGATAGFDTTIRNMLVDYSLLRERIAELIPRVTDASGTTLYIDRLKALTAQPARVILELLAPYCFNYSQCEAIIGRERTTESRRYRASQYIVYVVDGCLQLYKSTGEARCAVPTITRSDLRGICEETPELILEEFDCDDPVGFVESVVKKENDRWSLYLDADRFDSFNRGRSLTWRGVEPGDRMRPLGMNGRSRLLSDILSDAHAHPVFKPLCRVLVDGAGDIVWLAPMRVSATYAVGASTKRIYRLVYNNPMPNPIKLSL